MKKTKKRKEKRKINKVMIPMIMMMQKMNMKTLRKTKMKELKGKLNVEHETFRVSGNCEMCKAAIEKAVNALYGVNSADWNIETKQIHISFNKDKVSLDEIHKAIAAAGYDTDKKKKKKKMPEGEVGGEESESESETLFPLSTMVILYSLI